ncbi:hypothetical protein H4R19_003826, partial [Coemansia spiralis]
MALGGGTGAPSADEASAFMLEYGRFEAAHRQQLEALDLPKRLWQPLFAKLSREVFDIGDWAVLSEADGAAGIGRHQLCLSAEKLDESATVFLVDHAWTTSADQAADDLGSIPGLLDRIEQLTGIHEPRNEPAAASDPLGAAIDANVPVVMSQADVDEATARELLASCLGDPVEAIMAASDRTRGGDSAASGGQASLQSQILRQLDADGSSGGDGGPTRWATRGYECVQYALGSGDALDGIDIRVPLRPETRPSDVKCTFAPRHVAVSVAGAVVVDGELHAAIDVDSSTWAIEDCTLCVSLVKRDPKPWPVAIVGEQHIDPRAQQKHVQRVVRELWRYFQGYDYMARRADRSLAKRTNWYIQDEVGLAIAHSDSPNVRCLPFLYLDSAGRMTPFSVLWPVAPVRSGDALVRDYCPRWLADPVQRQGYLLAILQGPAQFALDAWEELAAEWTRTAQAAAPTARASAPAPRRTVQSLFIASAGPEAASAITEAGYALADTADGADVVFDDGPHADKLCSQHNLCAALFSAGNAAMVLQRIAGAQTWLARGFHLRTQITEFVGAAMMASASIWLLVSDQGMASSPVLTSSWAAAVRHVDVGYTAAVECPPAAIADGRLTMVERLVLLTPDNGIYLWTGAARITQHA